MKHMLQLLLGMDVDLIIIIKITVRILSLENNGSPAATATTCTSKFWLGTLYMKMIMFLSWVNVHPCNLEHVHSIVITSNVQA